MREETLKRQLGLKTVTALLIGEVIAVGIFLTPAGMAKSLGSPLWLLVVWVLMGAVAACGALCYGELAARFPEAGGAYAYLREAYGPRVAFLYGWMSLLVVDPGITAALAVGLAKYANYLLAPSVGAGGEKLIAVASVATLALVNVVGIRLGAEVLRWLTILKVGILLVIPLWGFGLGLGSWSHFAPFVAQRPGSAPLAGALAGAVVAAFFSFGGWWNATKIAGEVRDPERAVPRALILGIAVVTFVYVLTSAVFLYLVPLAQVSSGETFAAQVGEVLFGGVGGKLLAGVVIVSVLGSMAGIIMAAPRVYYAMAQDDLFWPAAGRLHPRFGTPARAITVQAALAAVMILLGTFEQILAYFIFVAVVFVGLGVAAVFVFRRRDRLSPGATTTPLPPQFRAVGYPLTPLIYLALTALMLILLAANNYKQAALGALIVLLGLPVYEFVFRKKRGG